MKKIIFALILLFFIVISLLPQFLSFERTPYQKNWIAYKEQFITDGQVIDRENNNLSSSEGQGFALLFAVFSNDRKQFEKIWARTQQHMQRKDYLFRGQVDFSEKTCDKACISSQPNASNGDIIIAWALFAAENKWDRQIYLVEGFRVLDAIKAKLIDKKYGYQLVLPTEKSIQSGDKPLQINLSYWVFPAFNLFADITGDPIWSEVYQSGVSLMKWARFGKWDLPADWMMLSEDKVTLEGAQSSTYGENANRLPLYLMLAKNYQTDLTAPYIAFWAQESVPASVDLLTDQVSTLTVNTGMQAIQKATEANLNGDSDVTFPEISAKTDYYSATFILLSQLAMLKQ